MAASFGKMPTTSVRRLISPMRRSSGLVECSFVRWAAVEGHVGENVCLGLIHQARSVRRSVPRSLQRCRLAGTCL